VYAHPASRVGNRKPKSDTPPEKINKRYDKTMFDALKKTIAITETKKMIKKKKCFLP
jgi:hypothetical protein